MPIGPIRLAALSLALLLGACGSDNREAGGVTKDEAEALDEAAEMLEGQRLPAEAIPPPASAPAATGTPAG